MDDYCIILAQIYFCSSIMDQTLAAASLRSVLRNRGGYLLLLIPSFMKYAFQLVILQFPKVLPVYRLKDKVNMKPCCKQSFIVAMRLSFTQIQQLLNSSRRILQLSTLILDRKYEQVCFYHPTQSNRRKIQHLGLTNHYKESEDFRQYYGPNDLVAFVTVENVQRKCSYSRLDALMRHLFC